MACIFLLIFRYFLRHTNVDPIYANQREVNELFPGITGTFTTKNKRSPSSIDVELIDWHNYSAIETEKLRKGPGEQGSGVHLDKVQKSELDKLFRQNGFNALASDQISLRRSLRDVRHPSCKDQKYLRKLPHASIIIPFHQEHLSTLLRTVVSCMIRAPKHLIKEVILVDDFSTKPFLKSELEEYVKQEFSNVYIIRAKKREGLIRTRLLGAAKATGDVLIFLDSHCECNVNWLPPLLEPIALDYRTAVCPFIDVINYNDFDYTIQDNGQRGVFNWEMLYKRIPLTPDDLKHPSRPFNSPVMAGGLFAISARWFNELGGYDRGLDVWGAEQYELSFKIWQCGGRLVDAPCSRIGHVYRNYNPFGSPAFGNYYARNHKRVAEVWMDEYKDVVYTRMPGIRAAETGDLTEQKAIRERLHCKPFKWFMTQVASDLERYYPIKQPKPLKRGEIRNPNFDLCIDTRFAGHMKTFGVKKCLSDVKGGNGEQGMEYSWRKEIKPRGREQCFDVAVKEEKAPVLLYECHGQRGNQEWHYNEEIQQIKHVQVQMCIACDPESMLLFIAGCDSESKAQQWLFRKTT